MVTGLELFRDRFEEFADCYVLIGGAASQLALAEVALEFRATKDLDIILCIEALDDRFVQAFWTFVKDGGYARKERTRERRRYYRFQHPADGAYPHMLELFSRRPDDIVVPDGVDLTPIPTDSEVSSLSAILLNDTYYDWVMAGRRLHAGIPIVGAEHLIPLKARAYLDLSARLDRGEKIQSRDIKKHRNDIVRLLQLLTPTPIQGVPESARYDVRAYVDAFDLTDESLKNLKVTFNAPQEITELLQVAYSLGG